MAVGAPEAVIAGLVSAIHMFAASNGHERSFEKTSLLLALAAWRGELDSFLAPRGASKCRDKIGHEDKGVDHHRGSISPLPQSG